MTKATRTRQQKSEREQTINIFQPGVLRPKERKNEICRKKNPMQLVDSFKRVNSYVTTRRLPASLGKILRRDCEEKKIKWKALGREIFRVARSEVLDVSGQERAGPFSLTIKCTGKERTSIAFVLRSRICVFRLGADYDTLVMVEINIYV